MALTEFELIRRYFATSTLAFDSPDVILGPGDDGAIIAVPSGQQLVISMDTLNEAVHFPCGADPFLLAQRSLLVNLSDLAAMGAQPLGFTLALSMPQAEPGWLQAFSEGLAEIAVREHCPLVGGDTTKGPLSVTIQVHGSVPAGQAILRSGARPGDAIYVTGRLGDAAAALWWMLEDERFDSALLQCAEEQALRQAFYQPGSRIQAGIALRSLASAGLDISDGLASDLQHILRASSTTGGEPGAELYADKLPCSDVFRRRVRSDQQVSLALSGGDDYELCVCIPPHNEQAACNAMQQLDIAFTRIGAMISTAGIVVVGADGNRSALQSVGYMHFSHQ